MISNYLTFFTGTFDASYDPIHLILGGSVGIITIVIIIKKIMGMRNKKSKE